MWKKVAKIIDFFNPPLSKGPQYGTLPKEAKTMKYSLLFFVVFSLFLSCTPADTSLRLEDKIVEAACGQCQFQLKSEKQSCDLAIRVNGKAYFVDGSSIDDHGDAHAADGFCQRIRNARVTGEISKGRFHAESFQVLPLE